jgi:Xaa-Pro aminopeptidase/Xaa-Pro dipeptidase
LQIDTSFDKITLVIVESKFQEAYMYEKRIAKLREKMGAAKIDAVFIAGDHNRNYLSGFTGNESYSFITLDNAFFITDSRFTEQASQQVQGYEIIETSGKKTIAELVSDLADENGISSLGFEEDVLTFKAYSEHKDRLRCGFVPMKGMVEELRMIKDSFELDIMRKAAEIADSAFEHILKFIQPGMTEREIGIELEMHMKKNGASALSFPSIVASGTRSSLPHGEATDKRIAEGEFLTLDFGCVYREYCSDMTRTIVIGKPSGKMAEIYGVVLEAQLLAAKSFREGAVAVDVDKVARDYIAKAGYGENFGHSLGHGVGRQVHEAPTIGFRNASVLKAGMVLTNEPGIYLPGFGGVRIEDILVITGSGSEILSKSTKEIICI